VKGCRGHVELAKQAQVLLGEIHDHRDQLVDALRLQTIANAREGAGTLLFHIATHGIGGERHRDDVLAEAPVLDCGQEHSPPICVPRPVTTVR
jgi:hypothetical protein